MDEGDKGRLVTIDRCEWVNVSSGTGSPVLSRTNPKSCKMVVCVCVCVPILPVNAALDLLID